MLLPPSFIYQIALKVDYDALTRHFALIAGAVPVTGVHDEHIARFEMIYPSLGHISAAACLEIEKLIIFMSMLIGHFKIGHADLFFHIYPGTSSASGILLRHGSLLSHASRRHSPLTECIRSLYKTGRRCLLPVNLIGYKNLSE